MTEHPADRQSRPRDGEARLPDPRRPPDARRRFQRRLLLIAVALVVAWVVVVGVVGAATGLWQGRGPRGLRLLTSGVTVAVGAAIAVAYRRVSRSIGDLLGAAEQVASGAYQVDVDVRGPRELRLLTATFNEMAARLASNEEQRRRFLADITHELRNPLAVLQSEIEAQLDGVHPRDDRHLASLLEETRRLGHLVDDLHTLALAETGRLVLHQEAVAIDDLVEEVIGRHQAHARQRDVTLRASIVPVVPKAWVDTARVRQILDNLLANAIRHTPAGGAVLVEVSTVVAARSGDHTMVRCQVTDTGPGFRDDQVGQVFERFKQVGDTRGSGLGLSIAHDLVQAQGGTIEASNDPATGGATVTFTLPT
jgi:signal transduction histidine kinase